jgi:hypothetical protein
MNIRQFFGKIRRKILRILLGRDLFSYLTNHDFENRITNRILESGDTISHQLIESINKISHRIDESTDNSSHQVDSISQQVNNISYQVNSVSQQINNIFQQVNNSTDQISRIKTLLLLKEYSPELLRKISSKFSDNELLINNLSNTGIFQDLRDDFKSIPWQIYNPLIGESCVPFNILHQTLVEMGNTSSLKIPAFSMLGNISFPNYLDNDIAYSLEKMYEKSVLQDQWSGIQYMAFLLVRKEEEKAKEILKDYLNIHDKQSLTLNLLVSDFAYHLGIENDDIATASELFQIISSNTENQLLEKYIAQYGDNVTIAIVGNGPHELNTGNGTLIDSHDIVVRFNNYNESPEYMKDYGSKVNIVFFAVAPNNEPDYAFRKSADILACRDIYHELISIEFIKAFKENPKTNIVTINTYPTIHDIQSKYAISNSTTGLMAVYFLKKVLKIKKLKANDLYGFALKTSHVMDGHYDNKNIKANSIYHNFDKELEVLQDIFNENK